MRLEEIMLNEVSQTERVNYHIVSLICGALQIAWRTRGVREEKGVGGNWKGR